MRSVTSESYYLENLSAPNGTRACQELLCLLIEGIGKHAVEEDPGELSRFQQRIEVEADHLKQAADQDHMRQAVEAIVDLMAAHNEAVKTDHRAHYAQLTGALRMMSETIGFVGKSSQAAVHQLAVVEKNLEEVTASHDAQSLRLKLGICLKMIREQNESLQTQSNEHLNQLKAFVASSSAAHQAGLLEEAVDAATGLPGRVFAENLIQEKFSRKTDCLVGVVRVDRLGSVLAQYGQAAVDELMQAASKQLAQQLPEGSTLCRWSLNSFIAVTELTSSYAETAQQWRKVDDLKLERNFEKGVGMPTSSLLVEHLRVMASRRGLIQNLDRFVAHHSEELAA